MASLHGGTAGSRCRKKNASDVLICIVNPLVLVPDVKRREERIIKEKERSGLKCQKELKKNALIVLICIRNPLHGVPDAKNTTERVTKKKERR